MAARELLDFEPELQARFNHYLAQASTAPTSNSVANRPFVTLTYAMSLDSQIAAAPGTRTVLSGARSKAMTHYLRTCHDAIAVGAGTAVADNPTLNSRIRGAYNNSRAQPRPVVFDRSGRWNVGCQSNVVQAALSGHGKAPWVFVDGANMMNIPSSRSSAIAEAGGEYVACESTDIPSVLTALHEKGIHSIMIEGGAIIINEMLSKYLHLVDSVIITIAPVYLGHGGVKVCPPKMDNGPAAAQFDDITWVNLGDDVVMCGRPRHAAKPV